MVRPTQQSSTKRKRKSNDLIWARDGDHKNAQEHPAYLLENCNKDAPSCDNDKVWVEWSSNGTVACIPKSRISTMGLSSRRRRRRTNNNDDTRKSNDNNEPSKKDNTNGITIDELPTIEQKKRRAPPRKRTSGGRLTASLIHNKLSKGNGSITTKQTKKRAPPRKPHWPSTSTDTSLTHNESSKDIPQKTLVPARRTLNYGGQSKFKLLGATRTNNDTKQSIPKQILVEGCGISVLNGTYNLRVDDPDAPVFSKKGTWEGNVKDYIIYRRGHYWYIGLQFTLISSRFFYISWNTDANHIPPRKGWKVAEYGRYPVPTITYKHKSNDDNITSSSSVNETITDGEEDKKIAAVPSFVSSSSQLTTSAYDEDTDEDIAPDTVHSSQVKVKEEEEDTDDEGISPDPVESAQIKVKTEEDLLIYGGDTDDEDSKLDAPSPVVSSQVKNKEDNSYDMDTDGEDDTLADGNNNIPTVSSTESEANTSLGIVKVSVVKPSVDAKLGLTLSNEDPTIVTITAIGPDSLFSGTKLKVGMRLDMINGNKYSSYDEGRALLSAQCINVTILASPAVVRSIPLSNEMSNGASITNISTKQPSSKKGSSVLDSSLPTDVVKDSNSIKKQISEHQNRITKAPIPLEQKKLLEVDRSLWEQEKTVMEAEEQDKKALESKEEIEHKHKPIHNKEAEEQNRKSLEAIQHDKSGASLRNILGESISIGDQYPPLQSHNPWQSPYQPWFGLNPSVIGHQQFLDLIRYNHYQSIQLSQCQQQKHQLAEERRRNNQRVVMEFEAKERRRKREAKKKAKLVERSKAKQVDHPQLQRLRQLADEKRKKRLEAKKKAKSANIDKGANFQTRKVPIPVQQKELLEVDRSFWEKEKVSMEAEERGKKAIEAEKRKRLEELEKELIQLSHEAELKAKQEAERLAAHGIIDAVATKRNADELNLYKEEIHWMFSSATGTEELLVWNDMKKGSFSNTSYVYYSTKDKFYILPEGVYKFWSTLFECKTWGDIRTKYSRGFYVMLMRMYIDNHSLDIDKTRLDGKCFKDDRAFNLSDFNPKVHHDAEYFPTLHCSFPPSLEQMQLVTLDASHELWSFGYNADGCLYFDASSKKRLLDEMIEYHGITPRYEAGMAKFISVDSVYKSHQSQHTSDNEVVEEKEVNDILCRLVDFETDDDDTSKKLNLEKGETKDIYCSRLYEWDDMESSSEPVNEFVWMIQGSKLNCLPKKVYNFWSRLYDCKTWGDVRASYTKGFYKLLMELRLFSGEYGPSRREVQEIENKRFEDGEEFDVEICDPGLQEDDACNIFPPQIEYLQVAALEWYCDELLKPFGEWVEDFSGDEHLCFNASEKTKVLEAIKGQGWKAQYEPGLMRFSTMYY